MRRWAWESTYNRFVGAVDTIVRFSGEIERVGIDANDDHLRGFGAQGRGFALRLMGRLDEAITCLERAYGIYAAIPAQGSLAEASADLAMCELTLGRVDEAIARLEAANRSLDAYRQRGFECTFPRGALPEAYLVRAASCGGRERKLALAKAKGALKPAVTFARLMPTARPWVGRLRGTVAWLEGSEQGAQKWWTRSVALAEEMELPHQAALMRLEIKAGAGLSIGRGRHRDVPAVP